MFSKLFNAKKTQKNKYDLLNKVVVVGDIHGDLNQLLYPLKYFIENFNTCRKIIFLGDYIDRGESNVYIYEIINKLSSIKSLKSKMIFLRGNHESYDSGTYDYMNTNVDKLNKSEAYIKTFMFDKFFDMIVIKLLIVKFIQFTLYIIEDRCCSVYIGSNIFYIFLIFLVEYA